MKQLSRFAVLSAALFVTGGCFQQTPIDAVKGGVLERDKSTTVGAALDNYRFFETKEWKANRAENGRTSVDFVGVVRVSELKSEDINNALAHVVGADAGLARQMISDQVVHRVRLKFESVRVLIRFLVNGDNTFNLDSLSVVRVPTPAANQSNAVKPSEAEYLQSESRKMAAEQALNELGGGADALSAIYDETLPPEVIALFMEEKENADDADAENRLNGAKGADVDDTSGHAFTSNQTEDKSGRTGTARTASHADSRSAEHTTAAPVTHSDQASGVEASQAATTVLLPKNAPDTDTKQMANGNATSVPEVALSKGASASGVTPSAEISTPNRASVIDGENEVVDARTAKALAIIAPNPEYPYEARRSHLTGRGVCIVKVDKNNGSVTDAVMEKSTGSTSLDNAAISGFRRWKFRPGTVSTASFSITFASTGASLDVDNDPSVSPPRSASGTTASANADRVCEAMQQYVLKRALQPLPKPIRLNVRHLSSDGRFCSFVGVAVFLDGSQVPTDYLPDLAYDTCLEENNGSWNVIYDLTRTDMPNPAELSRIQAEFPAEFPRQLLPEPWCGLIGVGEASSKPAARNGLALQAVDDEQSLREAINLFLLAVKNGRTDEAHSWISGSFSPSTAGIGKFRQWVEANPSVTQIRDFSIRSITPHRGDYLVFVNVESRSGGKSTLYMVWNSTKRSKWKIDHLNADNGKVNPPAQFP